MKNLKELIFEVRQITLQDYLTYIDYIAPNQQPPANLLHRGVLPALLLMPIAADGEADDRQIRLAALVQLAYMAQYIHNEAPEIGHGEDYRMSILIGDYLFAICIKRLVNDKQSKWLERIGNVICRMNEGQTVRSCWKDRNFVPVEEKVENLHKEYGELAALSGLMGADNAELSQEGSQIYTAFAYYCGIIQGLLINRYHDDNPGVLDTYISYCRQYLLSMDERLAQLASDFLDRLLEKQPLAFPELKALTPEVGA